MNMQLTAFFLISSFSSFSCMNYSVVLFSVLEFFFSERKIIFQGRYLSLQWLEKYKCLGIQKQ